MNSPSGTGRARPSRRIGLATLLALFSACALVSRAHAQLGAGWLQTNYTKRIHLDNEEGLQTFTWTATKSVGTGTPCADYSYDSTTDTETFRLLDGRTNRSEIRLQNEYSTGRRQFEGYVTFYQPLDDESLFQIFGSTSGATLCMMRGYNDNGGKIRVVGGIGDIATNSYGVERRINVIHDQDNFVQFYVDGLLKGQFQEQEQVDNYWKYGAYGTVHDDTVPAVVKWRAVRTWRDGFAPGILTGPPGSYEAENASLSGALVASSQPGFTGTGYADYVNPTGDYVQWNVTAAKSGLYDLKFKYALQSGDRPLQIQVNGQVVNASLSFPSTGAWTNWAYVTLPIQSLQAGANTIRATAAGANGPNVDHLLVSIDDSDFNADGTVDGADFLTWQRGAGVGGALAQGDANGSRNVDGADLAVWKAEFGRGAAIPPRAAAVPEPGSLLMALAVVIGSLGCRTGPPSSSRACGEVSADA